MSVIKRVFLPRPTPRLGKRRTVLTPHLVFGARVASGREQDKSVQEAGVWMGDDCRGSLAQKVS